MENKNKIFGKPNNATERQMRDKGLHIIGLVMKGKLKAKDLEELEKLYIKYNNENPNQKDHAKRMDKINRLKMFVKG